MHKQCVNNKKKQWQGWLNKRSEVWFEPQISWIWNCVALATGKANSPAKANSAKARTPGQTFSLSPSNAPMPRYPYCTKPLITGKAVKQHVAASQSCSKAWEMHQLAKIRTISKRRWQNSPSPSPPPSDSDRIHDMEMENLSHEFLLPPEACQYENAQPSNGRTCQ